MSDVGLGANLELSITDALRRVDQLGASLSQISEVRVEVDTSSVTPAIDAAIAAADRSLVVTADAAPITSSITSAVDSADTDLLVTGDASPVTGAIDGAVDAADTTVEVTGDASQLTGAVNGAIDAAQSEAFVEVEGSVAPGLQTDVLNLGANLADASDEGRVLGRVLGALSIGAAGKGLFELADAASEAEQAVGGASAVFGEAVGTIDSFATRSAAAAGLAATEARNLTSQIGGLLQGFDFTQREAAETSVVIAQLGADLAATFGGRPEEAVAALGGALRGEFNPLERFGVSLNVAQINAFALEEGMAASTSEIDLAVRAQAALRLIMERTANAQGQFARESETAAGVMSIARARAADLAAESGRNLTPALIALVDVVSRDVLPSLAEAGEEVLPAVSDAIENLAPLLGVTTDLLVAAAPVIELVADGLAAIPPEAIAIGGSLLIANRALSGLGGITSGLVPALGSLPGILAGTASATPAAVSGVGALGGGVQTLATRIATLNPLAVSATILAAGLFAQWQASGEEARRFAEEVDELSGSLEIVDGQTQLTLGGLQSYIRDLSQLSAQDQIDELAELGITITQVAQFAQRGPDGLRLFTDALIEAGDATEVYRNEFGELVDASGAVIDANSELGKSLEDVGGRLIVGNTAAIRSYEDIANVTEEVARRRIALLEAEGLISDAQVRTALATNDSGEATRSYAEALNDLEPLITAAARAQEAAQGTYDRIKAQYLDVAAAAATVGEEAPEVNRAIADIASGAVAGDRGFLNLALSLDQAALSEEAFAAAAVVLGTDVETLQGFVDQATESIDSFVETATQGLPSVSDVLGEVRSSLQASEDELARSQERDARTVEVSAAQFAEGLRDKAADVADFRQDLAALTEGGFADLAGMLAQQGQEAGDALADELASALASGNDELLTGLSEANETFQSETQTTVEYMRDVLGPELILVSGLMGEGAAQALFEGMDFGERIRIQGELAQSGLDEQGQVIAVIAATQGTAVAEEFGANLQLDKETIAAGIAAGEAMKELPTDGAGEGGESVGLSFGQGVARGIDAEALNVAFAAQGLVGQALIAARRLAGISSPSKLFRDEVGVHIGEGITLGLTDSGESVVAAAEAIVRDAADAVARVAPEVTAEIGGGGGIGGGGAIPDTLVRALEAIAAGGGGSDATQIGPFYGGDVRRSIREADDELRAIRRRRR